jgi:ATP-dependent helicase/nuclease subunit B
VDHLFSITAIEDYRSCPYRFFLKHVLKIKPAPKPTLLPELLDLGLLYHAILRGFGKKLRGKSLRREEIDRYWEILVGLFEEEYQEWQRWAGNQPAEMILSLKQEEIRKTLKRWLESELEWTEATAGRFKLYQLEWGFGINGVTSELETLSSAPYHLEQGSVIINVWGRIDRVDCDDSGSFVVYDYKLGRGPTVKDLIEMKDLQIPVYLLALEQLHFGKGQAVGGSYLGLRSPSRGNGGIWNREKLGPVLKGKSLLEQEQWEAFLEGIKKELVTPVTGIRSGNFNLTDGDCLKYCEYRDCCRRLEREVESNVLSS